MTIVAALFARSVGEDSVPLPGRATGEAIACLNYVLERGEADAQGVAWHRAVTNG